MSNAFLTSVPEPLRTLETDHFTEYWDLRRNKLLTSIETFIKFDGSYEIYSSDYLNEIAYFFGFTVDSFWSNDWSKTAKARLFQGVYNYPYIWQNQFTFSVLEYVLSCFDLTAGITPKNGFIVNVGIVNTTSLGDDTAYSIYYQEKTITDRILLEQILDEFFPLGIERDIVKL